MNMKGERLREELDKLGVTQVGFAKFVGVDQRTVRSWVADRYPIPHSIDVILYLMHRGQFDVEDVERRLLRKAAAS